MPPPPRRRSHRPRLARPPLPPSKYGSFRIWQVRKVPGTLRLYLHSPEHDHANDTINSSHIVNEFW